MHFYLWELPSHTLALLGLLWYAAVVLVVTIGTVRLLVHYLRPTPAACSSRLPLALVPHVTIIRPVNGREPLQEACLASTFQQNYPAARLTVYFCVSSHDDAALPLLRQLVAAHPAYDARVFIEAEDINLHGPRSNPANLGPNPKIRNMSAAYRAAKGDLMWIVDSNVWVSASACGLMVDRLCGLTPTGPGRKYKFVHQLPLAVDVSAAEPGPGGAGAGAALDELFLATAHAKFYTAISTVAVAPCSVGKSNMFRRSHLGALTAPQRPGRSPGIDFFSDNICEDHLIGDLLWKQRVPVSIQQLAAREGRPAVDSPAAASSSKTTPLPLHDPAAPWGNHALVLNPPCIQPLAHTSLAAYVARRSRWLRVRKFTVPAATAVEPGTESLVATACLATAATNVPWLRALWGLDASWASWWRVFGAGMLAWAALDLCVWLLLMGWAGEGAQSGWPEVREDASRPGRALGGQGGKRKSVLWWLVAWIGREALAFPVWAWAVLGGRTVRWRGRAFKVSMDARVRAVDEGKKRR